MHSRPTRLTRQLAAGGVGAALLLNVWSVAQASSNSAAPSSTTSGSASSSDSSASGAARAVAGTAASSNAAEARPVGSTATTATGTPATGTSGSTPTPAPATTPLLEKGKGTFSVVDLPAGTAKNAATKGGQVFYTVEIEDGIVTDRAAFARTVATTLQDARGWQKYGSVRFVNVTAAQAKAGAKVNVRISLTTPKTVDAVCAPMDTMGQVSCHNKGRVAINLTRWVTGAPAYGKDLVGYRTYLVNHEVGHNLGNGHATCPGKGQPAPVMMQQTLGLDGCVASPWPADRS